VIEEETVSAYEQAETTVGGDARDLPMAVDRPVVWSSLTRRLSLALLVAALAGLSALGCGGSAGSGRVANSSATTTSDASTSGHSARTPEKATYFKHDDDEVMVSDDNSSVRGGSDDPAFLAAHGEPARPADWQAIKVLVIRYYAVALASDGTAGCSLLSTGLATSLATSQAQGSRSPPSDGKVTCAAVLSSLFKYQHQRLIAELPTMGVTGVRVKGDSGFALLGFRAMPERQITVEREGGAWKLAVLFDSEVA
jgi:hypothetical protein